MFLNAYKKALDVIMKKPIRLWGLSLMSALLTGITYAICGIIPALAIAVVYIITCGMAKVYLDGLKGLDVESEQLFYGFANKPVRVAGALAWRDLWLLIWSMVPIAGPIIVIVKAYQYRFVPYIVMTRSDVTATEALKLSMKKTEGKKMDMFLADLCFAAGIFVVCLVLTILAIIPYIGVIFRLALFIVLVLIGAFSGIFCGLYQASFYEEDAPAKTEAPELTEAPAAAEV